MVRIAQLLTLSAVLFAVNPVSAQHNPHHHGGGQGHTSHGNGNGYGHEGGNSHSDNGNHGNGNNGGGNDHGGGNNGGGGNAVPELDPKSGASAFALLAGLALLAGSRKRRED